MHTVSPHHTATTTKYQLACLFTDCYRITELQSNNWYANEACLSPKKFLAARDARWWVALLPTEKCGCCFAERCIETVIKRKWCAVRDSGKRCGYIRRPSFPLRRRTTHASRRKSDQLWKWNKNANVSYDGSGYGIKLAICVRSRRTFWMARIPKNIATPITYEINIKVSANDKRKWKDEGKHTQSYANTRCDRECAKLL